MFVLNIKEMQELVTFYKIVSGRRLFYNGCISSWVETCWGVVSLCAYRKEQCSAQIADICSFFPSSLEHCNAMRILSVWATSQTHWGTWGGWGVGGWVVKGGSGGAHIGEEGKGGGGGKQVHIQPCASGFRTHWHWCLGTLSTMTTGSSKRVQIVNFGYLYVN